MFMQKPLSVLFSLLLILGIVLTSQQADATIDENLYKFDMGFYEKIERLQSDLQNAKDKSITRVPQPVLTHSVIIVTNDGYETQLTELLQNIRAVIVFTDTELDYVIAEIPINHIIPLVLDNSVVKIGDGTEQLEPMSLTMSQARSVVGASNVPSNSYPYTGQGITVGIIDTGVDFSHPDLQNKESGKVRCAGTECNENTDTHDHGTALAAIISADSDNNDRDGIASDSQIYNIVPLRRGISSELGIAEFVRSLSHLHSENIKIAMTSLGSSYSSCGNYSALAIIIDRVVDKGMSFSIPIGNRGMSGAESLLQYACGFNPITVGSVDSDKNYYYESSQGPAQLTIPSGDTGRIKPEITAIGFDLDTATTNTQARYKIQTGTSYANAFVAGASALILEKQSEYAPLEIKSALLLGADWKANVPSTANDYDNRITGIYDTMNKYGFGVLNIAKSLDYANSNEFPNILRDTSSSNFPDQRYQITANQNDKVKVLLSWMIHPRDSISNPTLPINSSYVSLPNQFHNYDLKIQYPDGTIKRSTSNIQNNEFIVFNAPQTGHYIITVSSDGTLRTVADEPFVLASTHGIDKAPFTVMVPPTDSHDPDGGTDPTQNPGGNSRPTNNQAPDADVEDRRITSSSGLTVILDGTDSSDPENRPLTYLWEIRRSGGLDISINNPTSSRASLVIPYGAPQSVSILVRLTVSDGHNSDSETVTITAIIKRDVVFVDTTPPTITTPDNIVKEATGTRTLVNIGSSSAQDDADPSPVITNDAPPRFPVGSTRVTWTAQDASGNASSGTQIITILDTTAPVIVAPSDIAIISTGTLTLLNLGTATATDLVDLTPAITNNAPTNGFRTGTTTVIWTATDDFENSASVTQSITIHDSAAIVRPDYVYSDDGKIKIRFSPRIDESASSVSISDFTVSDGTRNIPISHVSLTTYKAVLTLSSPVTNANIGSVTVSYHPGHNNSISAPGRDVMPAFDGIPIVDRLPATVSVVRPDYVYSDDGTIKIRFSPRIDESASSASTADFAVSDGTGNIRVTHVSLTTYRAVLTLSSPITNANVDSVTVSYNPRPGNSISAGSAMLPAFYNVSVTDRLPATISGVRPDFVYSDDGKIKIRFSPRIDVSASHISTADFTVSHGSRDISISHVSLTTYKAVLTLSSPVTNANIGSVTVSYHPRSGSSVAIGAAMMPAFSNMAITNLLPAPSYTIPPGTNPSAFNDIISDTFNISLDSWSYDRRDNADAISRYCSSNNNAYRLSHSSNHGGSANVSPITTCWFGSAGAVKAFDFPSNSNTLSVSLDYKSIARIFSGIGHANNIHILVADSADTVIYGTTIYRGDRSSSVTDTDWHNFTVSIPYMNSDRCPCTVYVYLIDSWSANWHQQIFFDDVDLDALSVDLQSEGVVTNIVPNSLHVYDLLNMQSSNSTVVNTVNVYSDAIYYSWDADDTDYKVVIAPSDSPRAKFADITSSNNYTFVNLEPSTIYDIRVGVRGDDTTQSTLQFMTLPADMLPFDSGIELSVDEVPGGYALSWLDSNDLGNNRYRVEQSVDDSTIGTGSDTSVVVQYGSDWNGKTITWRVYEHVGDQKIYSNSVSVTVPLE